MTSPALNQSAISKIVGRLHAVGPVADVAAEIDGIVPADGARL